MPTLQRVWLSCGHHLNIIPHSEECSLRGFRGFLTPRISRVTPSSRVRVRETVFTPWLSATQLSLLVIFFTPEVGPLLHNKFGHTYQSLICQGIILKTYFQLYHTNYSKIFLIYISYFFDLATDKDYISSLGSNMM